MRTAILVGLAAIAVGAALSAWPSASPDQSTKARATPQSPPPIPITDGRSEARNVPVYVSGIGTVQGFNTVAVKSRVDGEITKVLFKEGQDVKQGDPLFQIDPRAFQAALDQAEATKQRDEAQLQGARLDLDRYAKLVVPGFQSRQSFEDQKATVGQLEGTVKADEAQIESARLNLDYALIRAPIDGRTGQRVIDAGNYVQAAQNALLVTITQIEPIFVSFNVPQDTLDQIRGNQMHEPLEVDAFGPDDKTLVAKGKLTLIDNQVDVATGTVHLKATFENADERLWPGEFVNARLVISVRHNAITVPAETVMQGPNGPYVYVIASGDTVERRDVRVGMTVDGQAVIDKGLSVGEHVVVDGQYRLSDASRVTYGAQTAVNLPN